MKTVIKAIFPFFTGVLFAIILLAVCSEQSSDSDGTLQVQQSNAESFNSQNQQDQITQSRHNAITSAIAKVSPAVVGINVKAYQQYYQSPYTNDPFFRFFFPRYKVLREVQGLGSGFIFSKEGHIITNHHVVDSAIEIVVTLPGGEQHQAERIGFDHKTDIAILKIKGNEFPVALLGNSDDIIIGEWAIAIGNPFGLFDVSAEPIVTVGVISAIDQDFGRQENDRVYEDMIQTDAAINSGNSGGPLVNSNGEVIGINTFIFSGSGSTGTNIGLGFAIPINEVKLVLDDLIKHGGVQRDIWESIQFDNITPTIAYYLRMTSTDGVIVTDIEKNSPWEEAGLEIGDVITEIKNRTIISLNDLEKIKSVKIQPGQKLEMKVFRNGRKYKAEVQF